MKKVVKAEIKMVNGVESAVMQGKAESRLREEDLMYEQCPICDCRDITFEECTVNKCTFDDLNVIFANDTNFTKSEFRNISCGDQTVLSMEDGKIIKKKKRYNFVDKASCTGLENIKVL